MNHKGLTSLFIQYIEGSISKEDKNQLEKLLQKNSELRRELEMHLELSEILSDKDTMDFRDWIYQLIKDVSKE